MAILFIFNISYLFGQLADEDFTLITSENGLSNNQVNVILQDHKGFLWLGTNDGLNRYDGQTIKVFNKQSKIKNGIGGNIITDIIQDADHKLWIATQDGGISVFDPYSASELKFRHFKHNKSDTTSIPTNFITTLLDDGNGLIWFGTEGHGVLAMDKKSGKIIHKIAVNARNIIKLFKGPKDEIWVGRQGGGLLKINVKTGSASQDVRYLDFYKNLPHMVITSFLKVDDGYWIGSWDKVIYHIDDKDKEIIINKSSGFQQDIVNAFLNTDTHIWIGGENGIQLYDKTTKRFYKIISQPGNKYPITKNMVKCLFHDRNGIVWVGTSKGLLQYDRNAKTFDQIFLDEHQELKIYDVSFYDESRIDFATDKGIYSYFPLTRKIHLHKYYFEGQKLIVSKIYRTKNRKTFLGTNRSLFALENNELKMLKNTNEDEVMYNIIASRIIDIEEVKIKGEQCLITVPYGHYFTYYNFNKSQWYSRLTKGINVISQFGIKDNLIKDVLVDSNTILFSTVKSGINVYQNDTSFVVNTENNKVLQTNNISQVIRYKKGYIISTFGGGIYLADEKFKNLSLLPLSPNLNEGIYFDGELLWLISNGNLFQYHLTKQFIRKIMLPDKYKSGGISGKIYCDQKGTIYVLGQNYFIPINSNFEWETQFYNMTITDIKVGNSTINYSKGNKIFVPYDKNNIKFEFSVPHYSGSEEIKYSYKIPELSNEWIDINDKQFLEFYNMNSGKYRLNVRYSNINGLWNEYPQSVEFEIGLPVYKQWWFILILTITSGASIVYIYQEKLKNEKIQNTIRNKISQDLHDQVGATLTGINIYSKLAKNKVDETGNIDLHNLLEKISSSAQNTITDINDIVWAINPHNDSFEGIVNRMQTLMQSVFHPNNIQYEFSFNEALFKRPMDMSLRKNLFLIFRELINNILKHSACTFVLVDLNLVSNELILTIVDDGKGFDYENALQKPSMSGNGLKNIMLRVKENEGNVEVLSNTIKGTKTIIRLKI